MLCCADPCFMHAVAWMAEEYDWMRARASRLKCIEVGGGKPIVDLDLKLEDMCVCVCVCAV